MSHPLTTYWDKGERNVPQMTGAAHVLDAADLCAVLSALGLTPPLPNVLDVGCGTGRLARLVSERYLGLDIAPSAVAYCRAFSRPAYCIDGHQDAIFDTFGGLFAWVACISVFTHIGRDERRAYLARFATIAPNLLVDIAPAAADAGAVELTYAQPETFVSDLERDGYRVLAQADQAWDDTVHRYYRCEVVR